MNEDLRVNVALAIANQRWAWDVPFASWDEVGSKGQRVALEAADIVIPIVEAALIERMRKRALESTGSLRDDGTAGGGMMSEGYVISTRILVNKALSRCLCSVVHDEASGLTYDPQEIGQAIIRNAEALEGEITAVIAAATPLIERCLIERMRKRWNQLSVSPEALATWGLDELTYTQREQVSQWMQTWSDARSDARPGGEGQ